MANSNPPMASDGNINLFKRKIMTNILVTGCLGFIGYNLIRRLYADEIIGVDNKNDYYDVNIKNQRLKDLKQYENFKFWKTDICDMKEMDIVFNIYKPQYVIHLAGQAGVRYSKENPNAYIQSNIVGFSNVCELCKKYNVKHLVYASSSSVYGNNPDETPSKENDTLHPQSLYALTKQIDEVLASSYDFNTTGLRFFTVYGKDGRPDMFISKAIDAAMNDKTLTINGNGEQKRDFTHIDDIVCGIIMAMDEELIKDENHRIYNLGYGEPHTINDVLDIIEEVTGKKIKKVYRESNALDVQCTWSDSSRAKREIGWKAKISLRDGLKRICTAVQNN